VSRRAYALFKHKYKDFVEKVYSQPLPKIMRNKVFVVGMLLMILKINVEILNFGSVGIRKKSFSTL